jgi:hypothetical protein
MKPRSRLEQVAGKAVDVHDGDKATLATQCELFCSEGIVRKGWQGRQAFGAPPSVLVQLHP